MCCVLEGQKNRAAACLVWDTLQAVASCKRLQAGAGLCSRLGSEGSLGIFRVTDPGPQLTEFLDDSGAPCCSRMDGAA